MADRYAIRALCASMIMGRDDHSHPGYTLPGAAGPPRTRGWPVPAWTLAGAAAGVAVRPIPGRLSVSWDVASLLPDQR
jgi:hypothetical protein